MPDSPRSDEKIVTYYNLGAEAERLTRGAGQLELARTQEIIQRYLPSAPQTVLDVGGGAGIYALWLARLGYAVHLIDLMPLHIEQAQQAARQQPDHPLASATVGDARRLDVPDHSADAVLLLGPLYHLSDRADRVRTLREASRVLKPGGVVFAAAISRFASFIDGLRHGYLADPAFAEIVRRDLVDGQHRNPDNRPHYFTTAFFHHPDELKAEVTDSGLRCETVLAVEGPGWVSPNFDAVWNDPARRADLLEFVRLVETEPSLLGMSAHLIAIGRKE